MLAEAGSQMVLTGLSLRRPAAAPRWGDGSRSAVRRDGGGRPVLGLRKLIRVDLLILDLGRPRDYADDGRSWRATPDGGGLLAGMVSEGVGIVTDSRGRLGGCRWVGSTRAGWRPES